MTDTITALKSIIPLCLVIVGITILAAITLMQGGDSAVLTAVVGILAALGGLQAGRYVTQRKADKSSSK